MARSWTARAAVALFVPVLGLGCGHTPKRSEAAPCPCATAGRPVVTGTVVAARPAAPMATQVVTQPAPAVQPTGAVTCSCQGANAPTQQYLLVPAASGCPCQGGAPQLPLSSPPAAPGEASTMPPAH